MRRASSEIQSARSVRTLEHDAARAHELFVREKVTMTSTAQQHSTASARGCCASAERAQQGVLHPSVEGDACDDFGEEGGGGGAAEGI